MRLPFFRSRPAAAGPTRAERARAAAAVDESTLIEAARTRARRRLAGALVLLVIGIVGFPIVFETQPRPLPVDTPILVPSAGTARRDTAAPAPARAPARPVAQAAADAPADATAETAASAPPRSSAAVQPELVTERTAPASAPAAPAATAPPAVAAAPAPAMPASAAASGVASARFVVQVGAYTDPATLREARAKVEKLGLKTYTQVVGSEAGPRTRVRLGPYSTRDEADAAAARLKRAGLPANIVSL